MCTVTYIPLGSNNFILTSNRDENPYRKTFSPKKYIENNVELNYPKDELAGGTWIGTSNKKRLVCLLNGGFKNHIKKLNYKISRGVIVKKILSVNDSLKYINDFIFFDVEPFTLILVDWKCELTAHEFVWDGLKKHLKKLTQKPYIWSSSTLYTEDMKIARKEWFSNFLNSNKTYNQENILAFHKNDNFGTKETSLKMKRKNVETVSTTLIEKNELETKIIYIDFKDT